MEFYRSKVKQRRFIIHLRSEAREESFGTETRRFFEMRGKKKKEKEEKKEGKRSQVKQRKKKGEEERMESVLRIPGACLSKLKGGKHALLCLVEQKQHSTVRV